MEWHQVPVWVVMLLFAALVLMAFQCGLLGAELRFARSDANRWAWASRQVWTVDGRAITSAELDAIADAGIAADRRRWSEDKEHEEHEPNGEAPA